jgi:hypothetical protein
MTVNETAPAWQKKIALVAHDNKKRVVTTQPIPAG